MDGLSLALVKAAMLLANSAEDSLELRNRPDCFAGIALLRWQIAFLRLPETDVEEVFLLLRLAQEMCETGDLHQANVVYLAVRDHVGLR